MFDADLEAMLLTLDRRDRLDKAITEMAGDGEYTALVRRLSCLRGVSTLTAFGLAVEVGDWRRFTGATIGAYLGLVPTESSSGEQRSQGSNKAGNTHAAALVEAAWYYGESTALRARSCGRWKLATGAIVVAMRQRRLHQRRQMFVAEKKRHRQRRRCPRAGRLVLVAGRPRRLTIGPAQPHEQPGGDGRTWQRVERPARDL